jgi:hypothetical protein
MPGFRQSKMLAQHASHFCAAGVSLLLMVMLPRDVQAQDFSYTNTNGAITITGYTGPGGNVTIPSTIAGLPVTSIGDFAFMGNSSLTSATIPDTVRSIRDGAFDACTNLASVTIGSSVVSIGMLAFNFCTSLTSVNLPDSLRSINDGACAMGAGCFGAFSYCTSLTNVVLGNSVTNIGDSAFLGCSSLTWVAIPDSVIRVGWHALENCTSLTNVVIGNSVTNILGYFWGCTSLTAIIVNPPNTAYSSVDGVLFSKDQTAIVAFPAGRGGNYGIPRGVSSIVDSAFYYCTNLASVTLGDNITNIGASALLNCTSLTRLRIPDGVNSIGMSAFGNCYGLTNAIIGKNVKSLGDYVFFQCTNLAAVYFQGNAPGFAGACMGGVHCNAFDGDGATVYYLPGTTGWGPTFGDRPAVLWNPQAQTDDASLGVRMNRFGFNIRGTANIPIVVEASLNLAARSWVALQNSTLTNGLMYFGDPQWTNYPGRFYRIRSP